MEWRECHNRGLKTGAANIDRESEPKRHSKWRFKGRQQTKEITEMHQEEQIIPADGLSGCHKPEGARVAEGLEVGM